MKIAMMSAWNQDAGPSICAELIGREWVSMGHKLEVFSFIEEDLHGTCIVGKDEDYVIRCFGKSGFLDPRSILRSDFEIFITQDLGMLPKDGLGKIFHHIRKKGKTVNVIHDGKLSSDPAFYQFEWDAIYCFDDRYKNFLKDAFPEEDIHVIPHPCHSLMLGDKIDARKKNGLPLDKKIVLIFGQRTQQDLEMLPVLDEMGKEFPILLLIVSNFHPRDIRAKNIEIEMRKKSLSIDELYSYLHASDALLLNRPSIDRVVVSSTAFLCLGSGCPIVALKSNFFENFDLEVMKYNNNQDFKLMMREIFEHGKRYEATMKAAKKYVEKHSAKKIAKKYIDLFKSL